MSKTDTPEQQNIRPASSAIILRDTADGLQVFMVVRHHQIDFASGAFVFPGGKVDPHDHDLARAEAFPMRDQHPELPFWFAVIRETFEEAGLLLARNKDEEELLGAEQAHDLVERYRSDIVEGKVAFSEVLLEHNLRPALDLLVPFAHWITPKTQPKRFDTHFFLVAAPVRQFGSHDGGEAVEGVWTTPRQAFADADAGQRIMLPPTRLNLEKLAQDDTVKDAVARARAAKVVTVLPRVEQVEGGRKLHVPIEAGYGMSEFFVRASS